jgi:hypothetical protein
LRQESKFYTSFIFDFTMKTPILIFIFLLFCALSAKAQTYTLGTAPATGGATVNIACGSSVTVLDPGGAGTYGNNLNITVTFCSDGTNPLYFDFGVSTGNLNMDSASPGDSVSFYDDATGLWLGSLSAIDDHSFPQNAFGTTSNCVRVVFNSDNNATNDGGFSAVLSCKAPPPSCSGGNPPAADIFTQAPTICNLNGYCGVTSSYYGEDNPFNFGGTGGVCPVPTDGLFGGTVENNSWIRFQAGASNISFTFDITAGGTCTGVQAGIFAFDGSAFTLMSDCAITDGSGLAPGPGQVLSATGLTVGDYYYLMMDGNAGSACNYTITTTPGAVLVVSAGADQRICDGATATLTATGPTGTTFSWATAGGTPVGVGASVNVSPTVTTTYRVTAAGTCSNSTDDVTIFVADITDISAGTQTACDAGTNTYSQTLTITYTDAPTGNLIVNGQTFAITASPQSVTLTGLPANGSTVDVTASFESAPACSYTENDVFTAPAACNGAACSITDLSAGAQGACDAGTNTYTQEITVTYSNPPGSGNLTVNGQNFAITASPQTVTLTGLSANGANVNVTASFSADGTCTRTENALFTAPAACNGACAANNGTWN